jgi:vacuolar-type H+-ATPase catalytic subunit A/Vma1
LWEGQANENITLLKNWPVRKDFILPRKHNVEIAVLVNPENVLLPPLHMKL